MAAKRKKALVKKKRAKTKKKTAAKRTTAKKTAAKKTAAKKTAAKRTAAKTAAKKTATKKKVVKKAGRAPKLEFDATRFEALLEPARRGDVHTVVGVAPGKPIRDALSTPPEWGKGSYERLLALYVGLKFGHDWSGVIYDFAEHTYFRYDDDGYGLARVNTDLGIVFMSDRFGLFDEERALSFWKSAMVGPYPEGVVEELGKHLAATDAPLPSLRALLAAGIPERAD